MGIKISMAWNDKDLNLKNIILKDYDILPNSSQTYRNY